MRDDERIDFGPLDPARDAQRWERLVQRTVKASLEDTAEPATLWPLIARLRWSVAAFAACAALAWAPSLWTAAAVVEETTTHATVTDAWWSGADVVSLLETSDGH